MKFYQICLLLLSFMGLTGQKCANTYRVFNEMLGKFYLENEAPNPELLKTLDKECLSCFYVDAAFEICNGNVPLEVQKSFLDVVYRNKCRKVSNQKLQELIDNHDTAFVSAREDFICNYLIRYEQLLRNNASKELISQCDQLSYTLLTELIEDTSFSVSCLFPVLLHGSDKLSEAELPDFERSVIRRAWEGNFLHPGAAAMLLDRIYYSRFGYQKYGTMTMYEEFHPIMDVTQIDKFRKEIGLYPLKVEIVRQHLEKPENYLYDPVIGY